jgi:hypothetical protein
MTKPDKEQRSYNAKLRGEVLDALQLDIIGLTDLLGYETLLHMQENFTQDSVDICRALAGPYGFTIYKMILIRKDHLHKTCEEQ